MMNGLVSAYRRADCVVLGAVALLAVTSVSANEFNLYTNELQARAALPDFVAVTGSPVAVARARDAAESRCLAEVLYYEARGEGLEGQKAVAEVAKTLQIEHLLKRRPKQISGGEQQRVALGRAMVRRPGRS